MGAKGEEEGNNHVNEPDAKIIGGDLGGGKA